MLIICTHLCIPDYQLNELKKKITIIVNDYLETPESAFIEIFSSIFFFLTKHLDCIYRYFILLKICTSNGHSHYSLSILRLRQT